jgi:murein DD-endopeptidase MepM/ murein hydrolase activator NlpD
VLAAALGAGCLAGCVAGSAPKMTFAEAGFHAAAEAAAEAEQADAPPPVADPAPEAIATEQPEGPPIDPVLLRFAAEARARRSRHAAGQGFPAAAVDAWRSLAAVLDGYLTRPLPQTPLLELVRACVTVEAEWDYDARRFGTPPPELAAAVAARTARLATRVDAARALGLALVVRATPPRLRWPVDGAGISSPFGLRIDPFNGRRRMHRGVDLAVEHGRVVRAAGAGWVVRAGYAGGHGLMVEVRHPGDVTTRYSHLSAVLCAPGDAMDPEQPLGLVGNSGRSTGPHLHFEVWQQGEPVDPLAWLVAGHSAGLAGPAE